MKFRKKPVEIEAVRVSDVLAAATSSWWNLPEWVARAYEMGDVIIHPPGLEVHTLEGWLTAQPTDWLLQGVKGELYPCRADIFEMTYEVIE